MSELDELVFELPRGRRGALQLRRRTENGGPGFLTLAHWYPDPDTDELKPTRGVNLSPSEAAAMGAALTAYSRSLAEKEKPGSDFVGRRETARRGGVCAVCGGQVRPGEAYIWSAARKVGAHIACGREAAPARQARPGQSRQRELPGTRRQPQDAGIGAVSDDERRLAEETF